MDQQLAESLARELRIAPDLAGFDRRASQRELRELRELREHAARLPATVQATVERDLQRRS